MDNNLESRSRDIYPLVDKCNFIGCWKDVGIDGLEVYSDVASTSN